MSAEPIRVLIVEDHLIARVGLTTIVDAQTDMVVVGKPPTDSKPAGRLGAAPAGRHVDGRPHAGRERHRRHDGHPREGARRGHSCRVEHLLRPRGLSTGPCRPGVGLPDQRRPGHRTGQNDRAVHEGKAYLSPLASAALASRESRPGLTARELEMGAHRPRLRQQTDRASNCVSPNTRSRTT